MNLRIPVPLHLPVAPAIGREAKDSTSDRRQWPAYLVWLDGYFRRTPEERMQDPYIAYWH